ncbi:hypothetical protein AVEN_214259-1 [Araneus ventricosus]|uniref:Endonuclease/exonuclease/phosphatase domain-containing protein n=1 Tax=Araneus ventricosus TaxID=182803 RepID=A0A4Y2PY53_ARAVE|nr:hypothetical protein AVEN_214259-1 [Araneus ventricosus]
MGHPLTQGMQRIESNCDLRKNERILAFMANSVYNFPPTSFPIPFNASADLSTAGLKILQINLARTESTMLQLQNQQVLLTYYTPYSNIQYILQDHRGILSLLQKESIFIDAVLKGHNTVWGYKSNDTRGENIMKFILATDLCLLNTQDSLATFLRHRSVDWLDLTLCSHSLLQYAPHWEVLDDLTNRDY